MNNNNRVQETIPDNLKPISKLVKLSLSVDNEEVATWTNYITVLVNKKDDKIGDSDESAQEYTKKMITTRMMFGDIANKLRQCLQ